MQNIKTSKKMGKMKLPKMIQTKIKLKKNENINQLSDDENNILEGNNNYVINSNNSDVNNEKEKEKDGLVNIDGAPKIIKIVKKNAKNELVKNPSDHFKTIQEERTRIEKDNNF